MPMILSDTLTLSLMTYEAETGDFIGGDNINVTVRIPASIDGVSTYPSISATEQNMSTEVANDGSIGLIAG